MQILEQYNQGLETFEDNSIPNGVTGGLYQILLTYSHVVCWPTITKRFHLHDLELPESNLNCDNVCTTNLEFTL